MQNNENIVVSFRMESKYIEELKSLARQRSAIENVDITYADIIREMIRKEVENKKCTQQ